MSNIEFNSVEVKATIAEITEAYNSLSEKINELNQEKEKLSEFWSAKEAIDFSIQLANITTLFNQFKAKYEGYLVLLNNVIEAYKKNEDDFLSTIKSIAGKQEQS